MDSWMDECTDNLMYLGMEGLIDGRVDVCLG